MADKEPVVADDVDAPEPERSIRDELESSLAEVHAREEATQPATGEAPADRGDGRTSNGRFAPNPAKAAEVGAGSDQVGSGAGRTADRPVEASAGQPPLSAVEPPQGWSAQEKAVWSTVPPAAQAAIARRESDMHRKLTEHDEVRSVGNQFISTANEHAQLIQARGGNPVALFKEFLGILHRLHTGDPATKAQLLRQVAAQNGVNFDQPQSNGQAPSPQPQNFQLPPPVIQTVQEWNQFKARQEQDVRDREAAEMQQTTNEIETFRSDSAHPHFNAVTGLMASIIRSGVASTLEEAYSLAVKAHPETSKALEAEATAKRQAEEATRQKALAARRKAGSIRSGPGGSTPELNGSKGSVRDDLKAAMESVRGRI